MALNRIKFANFLCHFGTEKVLLDYLTEIVLPAFTDDVLVRTYGKENPSEYLFYETAVVNLAEPQEDPIIAVSGQFIKTVKLSRVQIFQHSQGLVHDPRSLDSSPSSTFLLVVNNHQLVFLPRTPHAPTIKEFETTTKNFILKKYHAYIDRLYEESRETPNRFTKTNLRMTHPMPNINVVPLADSGSISDFVGRFEKLKSIDFKILKPNPTISARDTFKDVRGILADVGADNAKLFTGNAKEGLDKDKAIEVITGATSGGNQEVALRGVDTHGGNLSGSNDDFKLTVPLETVPADKKSLSHILYQKFKTFLQADSTVSHITIEQKDKLDELARDL